MIFAGRQGYVARTLEDDQEMLQSYLPFLDGELIIIAENLAGNPVGLLVCLPDINHMSIKNLIIFLVFYSFRHVSRRCCLEYGEYYMLNFRT